MVPLWMGRLSTISYLYMRGNQLKGLFPHHLLQSSRLGILDMSHNSFSGSIPRNVNFSSLLQLRLQNNDFWGSIPGTLFKAERLQVLDLRSNNFSGKIPNTFGERSSLRFLLLGNNNLQSHVPEQICQLSEICLLDLSHNKFNGVIPSCLGNMSFGTQNFESWRFQDFGLSSQIFLDFNYITAFDLNNYLNRDFAEIATAVDFLTKSRYETYQGSIPYSISKLRDLESLDLSNNELSGNIPSVLADLDSLGFFNVSCNNFSGEIPSKGHLLTFGERSYIGNAHLCGGPTSISCNPTTARAPEESANDEEEDEVIDMEWFYWTCGAVYISTSLALLAFLCIDTRWSQEWFYRVDLFIYHLQRYKPFAFSN